MLAESKFRLSCLSRIVVVPNIEVDSLTICSLAYAEMRLILAQVLWNFDMELAPESDNWASQKIFSLWQKGPLYVKLTPVVR